MAEPVVVYEDKNFIAVNKPAGLLVHPVKLKAESYKIESGKRRKEEPVLTDWLMKRYPEVKTVGDDPENRPGIVHRLDKDTSGIMIVPRNQKYFEYLKSLFAERKIKKTYLAVVYGKFSERGGTINKPIGIKTGTTKRSVSSGKMVKEAVTEYHVLRNVYCDMKQGGEKQTCTLIEVVPKTGRTHQIRVHLASIGHPVVGDKLYGPKRKPQIPTRLMLHALSLEFAPEPGKRLKLETPPPPEFYFNTM